jgi:hypothetical protein
MTHSYKDYFPVAVVRKRMMIEESPSLYSILTLHAIAHDILLLFSDKITQIIHSLSALNRL